MGYLDVPAPDAHFKCAQQTDYFYQLGLGLYI
jgi:hypothetical protein